MSENIDEILEGLIGKKRKAGLQDTTPPPASEQIAFLAKANTALHTKYDFKIGDIVVQKLSLTGHKFPSKARPGIVVQILPEPIYDATRQASSNHFNEPYDIIIGIYDVSGRDGEIQVMEKFHMDSRRLELYCE
jgi:hypothetical protein